MIRNVLLVVGGMIIGVLIGWGVFFRREVSGLTGVRAWLAAHPSLGLGALFGVGGVLLLSAMIRAFRSPVARPPLAAAGFILPTIEQAVDLVVACAIGLCLAAAIAASSLRQATLLQAVGAFVFMAIALGAARQLFRTLGEGGRAECRTHWGGLGGGLGGVELSGAAVLLLVFLAALAASVMVSLPPAGAGRLESPRGITEAAG